MLVDVLSIHGAGGKTIVFTKTKAGADEVAAAVAQSQPCEALHGDIPQAQREKTLARFREGKFNVLVATDVAARGLDIPNVELVVHNDMPDVSGGWGRGALRYVVLSRGRGAGGVLPVCIATKKVL